MLSILHCLQLWYQFPGQWWVWAWLDPASQKLCGDAWELPWDFKAPRCNKYWVCFPGKKCNSKGCDPKHHFISMIIVFNRKFYNFNSNYFRLKIETVIIMQQINYHYFSSPKQNWDRRESKFGSESNLGIKSLMLLNMSKFLCISYSSLMFFTSSWSWFMIEFSDSSLSSWPRSLSIFTLSFSP